MKRQIRTFTVRSENNYNNNYGVIKVEERELEEKKMWMEMLRKTVVFLDFEILVSCFVSYNLISNCP